MNVFHKVTLQSLKMNRTRTVVTVIGIVLSAAMICAVTTFASSMQRFALDNAIYSNGDWHVTAEGVNPDFYDTLMESGEIKSHVYGEHLGYAVLEGGQNEYKPYLFLLGGSDGFFETMPVHLTAGRLPTTTDEVLIPSHVSSNGKVQMALGDTLALAMGDRSSGGFPLSQENPYILDPETGESETFTLNGETRTVTVVGFYERPSFESYTAPGYTVLTVAQGEWNAATRMDLYYKLRSPKTVYDFVEKYQHNNTINDDILMYSGVSRYGSFYTVLYSLAAIVIVLIMFGSVSLIYNAFAISVAERTRQFGLLSSIGATKKQLRRTVLFEAFVVSAVGIPIGIVSGIAGMAVTLALIGNKFRSLGFAVPMRVNVSVASVIVAALVALFTVLISAQIPASRATRITAVEAIRQNRDITVGRFAKNTSPLVVKVFGLPGVLASKYFKRSRKKYRTTVISLFMSIVLFISASSLCAYLTSSVEGGFDSFGFDIMYTMDDDVTADADALTETMRKIPHVTAATYVNGTVFEGICDPDALTDKYKANRLYTSKPSDGVFVYLYFVEDAQYRAYLQQNKLDTARFMNPENPLAVAVDGNVTFDYDKERYVTMRVLKNTQGTFTSSFTKEIEGYHYVEEITDDSGKRFARYYAVDSTHHIDIPYEESRLPSTATYGAVLYERPYFVAIQPDLLLMYPYSAMQKVLPQGITMWNPQIMMCSDDHAASHTAIKTLLAEEGLSENGLENYALQTENDRNTVLIIQVFSYGFIVLISLIAAANVFNTVSTNVALRQRELAMLRSVGMSRRDFRRMMNFECLLYGTKALLWGLPAAFGVTYLIHLAINEGFETAFFVPWDAVAIAVLSVFAVVFASTVYAMQKINRENPIDALRRESI